MKKVKCECGHVNPAGTVLCESCGKPLDDQKSPLADMRYDGSARRSQTYNKTIVDKVWNFFSSVKVGIWLIVITLAASAFGTVFPQEAYLPPGAQPDTYYEQQYGIIGQMYYLLGFHHLYGSWWYMLLIASIGISLVICSLDTGDSFVQGAEKSRSSAESGLFEEAASIQPDRNRAERGCG
ncbi:cytochrome c biogenesis protein ResB [Bacillus sp. 4A_MP3]